MIRKWRVCFILLVVVCAESIRDLGVIVDSGLTFDAHVNNVVSKAYARIAMLFRGFSALTQTCGS